MAAHRKHVDGQTCSIEGCDKPWYCRGWCRLHYRRWYSTGDPLMIRPCGKASPNYGKYLRYKKYGAWST